MKTITSCLIIFALQIASVSAFGQSFMEFYPTTFDKTSRDILRTPDGGYLICGMTNNSDITDCDAYVIKTDNMGKMEWSKTYGGIRPDYLYSMVETTDGHYFIVGYSTSYGGGDIDIYLLKIDDSGNVASGFPKTYGGFSFEEAREIIKTSDGNYVMVGTSKSYDAGNQQIVMIKIDNDGNTSWVKRYGGPAAEFGNSVRECADGGFIITGQTFSYGQNGDMYLVRTNSSGDLTWEHHWGGGLTDEGVGVEVTQEGDYIVAVRDSTPSKDIEVRVMKISADGNNVMWDKSYGGDVKDTPKSIRRLNDGHFIIGAISRSFGWINPDIWLLKINPQSGDTVWTRHFGAADHEHCHMAKQDPNENAILVVGHARSNINNSGYGQKIAFFKLNLDGQIGALGMSDLQARIKISAYPNPSTGWVYLELPEVSGELEVEVTDILGAKVLKQKFSKQNEVARVNLSGQTPGVYTVKVSCNGTCAIGKIVLGN